MGEEIKAHKPFYLLNQFRGGRALILIVNILEINILNLGSQHRTLPLPSWRTTNRAVDGGSTCTQRAAKDEPWSSQTWPLLPPPADGRTTGRTGREGWPPQEDC